MATRRTTTKVVTKAACTSETRPPTRTTSGEPNRPLRPTGSGDDHREEPEGASIGQHPYLWVQSFEYDGCSKDAPFHSAERKPTCATGG